MSTNSMQGVYRFSIFFALTSFLGCGLFSMLYFHKESELTDRLTKQAEEIKDMESTCATGANASQRLSACRTAADRQAFFYRTQLAKHSHRDTASLFLWLSCALPLLTVAMARWWYWVVTGRFRPRPRKKK